MQAKARGILAHELALRVPAQTADAAGDNVQQIDVDAQSGLMCALVGPLVQSVGTGTPQTVQKPNQPGQGSNRPEE